MTEHPLPEVLDLVITCELTSQTKPSYWTLTTWGRLDNTLAVKPKTISRVLSYTQESRSWEAIREAALEAILETPGLATTLLASVTRHFLYGDPKSREEGLITYLDLGSITVQGTSKNEAALNLINRLITDSTAKKKPVEDPTTALNKYYKNFVAPNGLNFKVEASLNGAKATLETSWGTFTSTGRSKNLAKRNATLLAVDALKRMV